MSYELEKMKRDQQEKFDALEAQNENLTRLLQSVKTQTQESGEEEDIDELKQELEDLKVTLSAAIFRINVLESQRLL